MCSYGADVLNQPKFYIITDTEHIYFHRTFFKFFILLYNSGRRRQEPMKNEKFILELTPAEHKLLIECLNLARSRYIDEGKPIEDVNVLLVKAMNVKTKKRRFS